MRRFVYSPKVYAWVKTDDGVINVSDYIVSGNVNRVVDQVSTAEIVLRNPDRVWTDWQKFGPTFRPMDAITIWLKRLPDKPVQVFTGYLDGSPYYQLYPGTVTLRASCTLKRLLHTYYDPALPHTQQFLVKYGWIPTPGTGQLINTLAQIPDANEEDSEEDAEAGETVIENATDGSIGRLLFATLKHIGGWHPNNIWIEALPPELYTRIAHFLQEQQKGYVEEEIVPVIESFLKKIIGEGGHGSGSATNVNLVEGAVAKQIFCWFVDQGYSPEQAAGFVGNAYQESKFDPAADQGGTAGNGGGYGLFQWDDRRPTLFSFAQSKGMEVASVETQLLFAIHELNGTESAARNQIKAADSIESATNLICTEYERAGIPHMETRISAAKDAYDQFNGNCGTDETGDSQGNDQTERPDGAATTWTSSRHAERTTASTSASSSSSSTSSDRNAAAEDDPEDKIYRPTVPAPAGSTNKGMGGGAYHAGREGRLHMGLDVPVANGTPCYAPVDGTITMAATSGFLVGGMIHLKAKNDVGGLKAGDVIGWGHAETALKSAGTEVKAGELIGKTGWHHLHFIYQPGGNGSMDGTADPTPIWEALRNGEVPPDQGSVPGQAGGPDGQGGDAMASAKAAAFATVFNFPTAAEMQEALMLTDAYGQQKSLMNDQALMPFIQQLTQGSMRSFQSLPNGNFFAFFPDYFGSFHQRNPYWNIKDIEILDGQIQLTDDALATHVYVVGDTSGPYEGYGADGGFNFFDKLMSQGVVSVFNAGAANFLNRSAEPKLDEPDAKPPKHGEDPSAETGAEKDERVWNQDYPLLRDREAVLKFLRKYGARPYVKELPLVRSHYFEVFLAFQQFQLMWSRQFLTTFTFTFMPELYPGGIVAFPEHGIQMYVDEVRHSFDYENGFTTQANLSAPAAMKNTKTPWNLGMIRSSDLLNHVND